MRDPHLAATSEVAGRFRGPESPAGIDEMLRDAILPIDVQPLPGEVVNMQGGLQQARHVLLTGATGFIGRWLAREILSQSDARLTCMVRPGNGDARQRLDAALIAAGVRSGEIHRRTTAIPGDLRQSGCGLDDTTRARLTEDVDAICHCAAVVNWVLPYRVLKTSSVDATIDLLRIAAPRSIPFHFVSSLTVGSASPEDGGFDPRLHLHGQHLGYAQAKTVAESLVREAGQRGLPVAIYRPSFIAGHSETGAFNEDDILARLVGGCVRMRTAPDLDWTLDCLPVDAAARLIVNSSGRGGTIHLAHPEPRHWRECVLWMRLYGYDVRLVPYHAWLRQLEEETRPSGDRLHPLRPLRSFFLHRPAGARRLTLPELMLERNRQTGTLSAADGPHHSTPRLDAALLQRYFDAFVASDVLPPTRPTSPPSRPSHLDLDLLTRAIKATVTQADPLGRLSDHSILSELTSWRSGQSTGLHRYRLQIADGPHRGQREVVVKLKPADAIAIEVGEALSRLCSPGLGDAYSRWSGRLGLVAGHIRELALYEQPDERWRRHVPVALGTFIDAQADVWAIVLESLSDTTLRDSVERPELWTASAIDSAITGLATLQSVWYGREADLRREPWIGYVATSAGIADMSDLWSAAAAHAAPRFASWTDPSLAGIQQRLIETIRDWWPALEVLPRTLIHNDFNPRNICLRHTHNGPRLIAYDWELACVGAPQRDLAELLCFVLSSDAAKLDIDTLVERHRQTLQRAAGVSIPRSAWTDGFRAAVGDMMLNRLPMYALVHRVRRQPFLPRIVQNWRRLHQWYPL